jgi:hypothetical protein
MDTGWAINNIGAIVGAFVVVIVAYFVFRSKSNKNRSENDSKASVSKVDGRNRAEEVTLSPLESVSEKQTSPMWKTRRYVLNKIRSLKKPDILPVKDREDVLQAIDNQKEQVSSMVETPAADIHQVPIKTHEENSEDNPDIEVLNEDVPEISEPVMIDDSDTVVSETENTNDPESTDNIDSPEIDLNAEPPTEETEETDDAQPEVEVTDNEKHSEKTEEGGNVFSLFTEEEEEENEISKFAANLDQVDVNKLRQDAENIQKYIHR